MTVPYEMSYTVPSGERNAYGNWKLSALLHQVQEISGAHCDALGLTRCGLAEKGLFWAVLRHRLAIGRLPRVGETVFLQTWPIEQTRTAYPRAVRALDGDGNILFQTASLWVLMDMESRAMVLPDKSGVTIPGEVVPGALLLPRSLHPGTAQAQTVWTVSPEDLDINGHVNNASYLAHTEELVQAWQKEKVPKEVTLCYLAENRLGQQITLSYGWDETGCMTVDGFRPRTDDPTRKERVYAAAIQF